MRPRLTPTRLTLMAALALLAACGPVSVEQAERNCLSKAMAARAPMGKGGFGVSSDGGVGGYLELDISTDYLAGRDPSQVYDTCVMRQSGQPPRLPLYNQPAWKG